MLEEILYEFLNNGVDLDAPVYTMIPKDQPAEYYVFELTGSSNKDHINKSTIVIRSHAQSLKRAADLAYDIDNTMLHALKRLDYIAGVERNTVSNFTDQDTRTYRYQGVYVITHY